MKQVLLAAVFLVGSAVAPAIQPRTDLVTSVPVVVCETSSGGAPVMPYPVPSEARVPTADRGMEVYSLVGGWFQILAPQGMDCEASVGADGTTIMSVAPENDFGGASSAGPEVGVSALSYPACQGCKLDLACPFFPAAEKLRQKSQGGSCAPQPAGQSVSRLNADAVAFSDPAGEEVPKSDYLIPNDSPWPINGVVLYYDVNDGDGGIASDAVCILPATEHHTCTEVLDEFVATRGTITAK
jgi:hypothetical protein